MTFAETAAKYMDTVPEVISFISKDDTRTSKTIRHLAIKCSFQERAEVIGDFLTAYCGKFGRAVVFAETKKEASELALSPSITGIIFEYFEKSSEKK